jgi:hypothetical protein
MIVKCIIKNGLFTPFQIGCAHTCVIRSHICTLKCHIVIHTVTKFTERTLRPYLHEGRANPFVFSVPRGKKTKKQPGPSARDTLPSCKQGLRQKNSIHSTITYLYVSGQH